MPPAIKFSNMPAFSPSSLKRSIKVFHLQKSDYRAAQGNPDQPEVRLSSEQVFPEEKPNISIQPPLDLPQNQ